MDKLEATRTLSKGDLVRVTKPGFVFGVLGNVVSFRPNHKVRIRVTQKIALLLSPGDVKRIS